MIRTALLVAFLLCTLVPRAQAVLEPVARTIKCAKAAVNCLVLAPKGDRILVGTEDGAELIDLATGKRVHLLAFNEDQSTEVWHAQFNENGEYVMLAGFTGKRAVYDLKTGQPDGRLARFTWLPNSLAMKAIGLKVGNSPFDRYYQQESAQHGEITAKADKNGTIVFHDPKGAAIQKLTFPTTKDVHYRAPCLFTDTEFITATVDGRVLFYTLR